MTQRRIHWLSPSSILIALIAGVLFALGHHLFYASLEGKSVQGSDLNLLGSNISRQQVNITAGTIFAFLVNFSLGTAVATAYAQVFWKDLLKRKATIESWDAAFSAPTNLVLLGKVWIWWRFPLLAGLVIIAWLLPLAATITPGTLNVGLAKISPAPTVSRQVPNVDFISLNYVGSMPHVGQEDDSTRNTMFKYQDPSTDVLRIADQVAQTGVLLPISPPYPNASWTLKFPGPGLKCSSAPESTQALVQQRLKSVLNANDTCSVHSYFAWEAGQSASPLSRNVTASFDKLNGGGLAMNLVAYPHMMDLVPNTGGGLGYIPYIQACSTNEGLDDPTRFEDGTAVQCQLRNVTYSVSFSYTNGLQHITMTTDMIDDNPINRVSSVSGDGQAYPNLVINGVDCAVLANIFGGGDPDRVCDVDTNILKTLSYQSIFDAFLSFVSGSVSRGKADDAPTVQTSIQNTVLVDTPELHFLGASNEAFPSLNTKPLQQYVSSGNIPVYQGLVNQEHLKQFASLPQTIETLFQNITVSMMSSRVLNPNTTSAYLPSNVTVTLNNIHPIYQYSSARLWLAYGLAIGFATITAVIGIWAVIANGASYTQDFSTIFRVARGASVSEEVKDEDMDGRDPLPDYLKKTHIWLGQTKQPVVKMKGSNGGGSGSSTASPTKVERSAGETHAGT